MSDTRKPIVIVGSITMDLVTRTPRIPAIGQTLIGTGFETTPGGKGANQAVAAARLGYRVAMVAKVGDDNFAPQLLENLKRAGVDTAAMAQTTGSSGLAPMFVADDGQNAIVVVPGANGKMDRAAVDKHADLIRSAGVVLCQLEIPMDALGYTLDLCAKAQVPVMLDPAPAAALPDVAFTQVAWFTPNE
ncbi:MAG: ribokinase, partial [Terracidiphilus sp.]|nr:ribokinase [Terracidiphilus sp.]